MLFGRRDAGEASAQQFQDHLHRICFDGKNAEEYRDQMKNCLERLASIAIHEIVLNTSSMICNRKLVGQHWSHHSFDSDAATSHTVDTTRATYQFLHRHLEEKVKQHKSLIDLVIQMVIFFCTLDFIESIVLLEYIAIGFSFG